MTPDNHNRLDQGLSNPSNLSSGIFHFTIPVSAYRFYSSTSITPAALLFFDSFSPNTWGTMALTIFWYCCECNFGPYNSSLYDECIQCGKIRCTRCVEEKPYETPQTSSTQETTRKPPNDSSGRRKRLQRQTTQAKAANGTVSSSRGTGMPKQLPRGLEPTLQSLRRRGSSTRPGTLPNNPNEDIQSEPFSASQPSTSYIIYSSSLGSILVDWVYEQLSTGVYSSNEVRALEDVLIELKNTQPGLISVKTEDELSFWNNLKGKVETIIGLLDWSPFQPYMAPLTQDQVRLFWECVCILPSTEVNSY